MSEINFGSNEATSNTKRGKQAENFGIITVELPNGQRVDGYILLSEKNLAKLGLTKDAAKALGSEVKTVSSAKLHVQFGERVQSIATPVAFD